MTNAYIIKTKNWKTATLNDVKYPKGKREIDYKLIGATSPEGQGLKVMKHFMGPCAFFETGDMQSLLEQCTHGHRRQESRQEIEASRPTKSRQECIEFCLDCLINDDSFKLSKNVCADLTYEELIGALLLARDGAQATSCQSQFEDQEAVTLRYLKSDVQAAPVDDVPLKDAMLAWNNMRDTTSGRPGAVAVVPWPDKRDLCERLKLTCTAGACSADWHSLNNRAERLCKLFVEAWHIVCRDGVTPKAMHHALMVIPEYREILTGEKFFNP